MTSVTSWCDAVKRSRDIQRRVGCAIGQARQVVVWSMSECYGRRGAVYLRQICRADSMRSHMSKRSHKYGVESRVMSVMGCNATVFSDLAVRGGWRWRGAREDLSTRSAIAIRHV